MKFARNAGEVWQGEMVFGSGKMAQLLLDENDDEIMWGTSQVFYPPGN